MQTDIISPEILRYICYLAVRRRDRAVAGEIQRDFVFEWRQNDCYRCFLQGPDDWAAARIDDITDDPYDVDVTIVKGYL